MEINVVDTVVVPVGDNHVPGPTMTGPLANGLALNGRSGHSAAADQTVEGTSETICLPDLSAENPFE